MRSGNYLFAHPRVFLHFSSAEQKAKERGDVTVEGYLRGWLLMMMAAIAAGVMVTGCSGAGVSLEGPEAAAGQAAVYRLKPGDKLKIAVFNEPDLTGEFQISDGGAIAFPLVGEVKASGMSIDEFRVSLTDQLKNGFVRNPRVTVDVLNYQRINVIGEVRNAGQYDYRPGISIQDAVAMAGGYTYRANTRTAYIRRANSNSEVSVSTDGARVAILPGDNIRIPERYF